MPADAPRSPSLRTRVSLLVLLAALPTVALFVDRALEREADIGRGLREAARARAHDAARWEAQFIQRTREALVTLARLPALRDRDVGACRTLFADLIAAYPHLMNLHVAGADGKVYCSARPTPHAIDASTLSSFRRALETREFALGERQTTPSGRTFFAAVHPIEDRRGAPAGVVAANFSVEALSAGATGLDLPADALFFSLDRDGTVLVSHPDQAAWAGRSLRDEPFFAAAAAGEDAVMRSAALDGTPRLYAMERVPGVPPPAVLYVAVGLDEAAALAAPRRDLVRDLAVLALVTLLGIVAAWLGGKLVLVRPLERLSATLERVGQGDLGARFGARGGDELEIIGRAADQMAEMLERREQDRLRLQWEREKLWREQEALHERLRLQLDLSPAACVLTDEEFRVTYFNPAAERIFGFGRHEVHGRTLDATIVAPAERAVHAMLCARLRRGETVAETSRNVDKRGRTVQLEWRHLPLRRPDGVFVGAMSMAVDVTERERAERELERLNRELEQRVQERTRELEAANHELEAFSYSVSHDLRAPVRHIGAYLHLLAAELGEGIGPAAREYLADAAAADQRMARIIDDLLAFSRSTRAPLHAQPVALEPLVQEVIAELAPETAGRRIDWRVAALATVEADPALLGIALKNLLGNAVKYTRPRATAHIAITAAAGAAGEVVIGVQDDGVGFDMGHAGKLFNPFQRLHDAQEFEGTGIGLATVQRIVARHGGRIWAEAEPGRGATFRFTLPVAP